MWRTKVYRAWQNMKQRVKCKRAFEKRAYVDRGITVCAEWMSSFEAFYAHVGDPPSPIHSLDRINNDGNYEPGNVRWATKKQQGENRVKGWRVH